MKTKFLSWIINSMLVIFVGASIYGVFLLYEIVQKSNTALADTIPFFLTIYIIYSLMLWAITYCWNIRTYNIRKLLRTFVKAFFYGAISLGNYVVIIENHESIWLYVMFAITLFLLYEIRKVKQRQSHETC